MGRTEVDLRQWLDRASTDERRSGRISHSNGCFRYYDVADGTRSAQVEEAFSGFDDTSVWVHLYQDLIRRLSSDETCRQRASVVVFPWGKPAHPEIAVYTALGGLSDAHAAHVHGHICRQVSTVCAHLKKCVEGRLPVKQHPVRNSFLMLPHGEHVKRVIEVPYLPESGGLHLRKTPIYLSRQQMGYERGQGMMANFTLYRVRMNGTDNKSSGVLDVSVFGSGDDENSRYWSGLLPVVPLQLEGCVIPGIWTLERTASKRFAAYALDTYMLSAARASRLRAHIELRSMLETPLDHPTNEVRFQAVGDGGIEQGPDNGDGVVKPL